MKDDKLYLVHVLESIDKIEKFFRVTGARSATVTRRVDYHRGWDDTQKSDGDVGGYPTKSG